MLPSTTDAQNTVSARRKAEKRREKNKTTGIVPEREPVSAEPTPESVGIPGLLAELVDRDGPESIAGFLRSYVGMTDGQQEELWAAIHGIEKGEQVVTAPAPVVGLAGKTMTQIAREEDDSDSAVILTVAKRMFQSGSAITSIIEMYHNLPEREKEEAWNALTDAGTRARAAERGDNKPHEMYVDLLRFADHIEHMQEKPVSDHTATEHLLFLFDMNRDQNRRLADAWGLIAGVMAETRARVSITHRKETAEE